jgi:hypothetical protein
VNVLRIAATATTIGISTAGRVPKTNRRITSAPRPPIRASSSTLGPPLPPCELASSSGSWPVTFTVVPAGRPAAASFRVSFAPLVVLNLAIPGG